MSPALLQLFCMEYKPTAKDTAMIVTHIEPTYLKVPFSTLTTSPATPQVAGESPFSSAT